MIEILDFGEIDDIVLLTACRNDPNWGDKLGMVTHHWHSHKLMFSKLLDCFGIMKQKICKIHTQKKKKERNIKKEKKKNSIIETTENNVHRNGVIV